MPNDKALFQLCYGKYEDVYDKIKYKYINYANKYGYDYILLKPNEERFPTNSIRKHQSSSFNLFQIFDYIYIYKWLMFIDLDIWISDELEDLVLYCKDDKWNQLSSKNFVSSLFIINTNIKINKINTLSINEQSKYSFCTENFLNSKYKNILDIHKISNPNIRYFTRYIKSGLYHIDNCKLYNIIHFCSLNKNNLTYLLPNIYNMLDNKTDLHIINKYILKGYVDNAIVTSNELV